nr:phospholipase-like protein [Tanacetum cinerariifolium]
MELKKILIEKMKGNQSIQRSNEQRNLYKALVEAYEADKIILDTYGERVILKRRRDDDDDQGEGPFAGSDRGRRQASLLLHRSLCRLPLRLKNLHIRCLKQEHQGLQGVLCLCHWRPKPKASARRKRSDSDTSITPPTAIPTPITTVVADLRLTAAAKGKQPAKAKSPSDPSELARTEVEQLKIVLRRSRQETHISQHGSDDEDVDAQDKDKNDDEGDKNDESDDEKEDDDDADKDSAERDDDDDEEEIAKIDEPEDTKSGGGDEEETESNEKSAEEETREEEEESFDPIPRTPEDSEDDGNGEEDQDLSISEEERIHEEEEADELYRDVNINQGRGLQVSQEIEDSHVTLTPVQPDGQQESSSVSSFVTSMLNPISDAGVESIFMTASSSVAPLPSPIPIMTPSIITTITTASHPSIPPTPIPSEVLQNLPTFDSVFRFNERLKSFEASLSEYRQTNPFAEAISNIPSIVHQYMNQQMHEAVRVAVQIQTDRLHDSYQRENDEFLKIIDDNIKRIIKEHVKSQVKDQVLKILPRIEQSVNAQLESEVLTRSSHSSRTSYAIVADLSKMELKKILIEKMEGNKSIQRSDKQRNLYKALEGPFAGSDQGSKRRREGGEPESASTSSEPATRSASRSTTGTQSRQMFTSESAFVEKPVQTTCQMDEPSHPPRKPPTPDRDWNKTLPAVQGSAHTWISELAKQADSRSSFNELLDTPIDFSNFIMNRLYVDTLTPELLAGPAYELIRGSCNSLTELEYHLEEAYKATTDQLDWVNPEGQQYPHNLLQPLLLIPDNQDVYKEYRHPTACERSSTGSQKLPEEAQPYQSRHEVEVPGSTESHIHNHMLIPDYQDNKYQDFCYSDELSQCKKGIKYQDFRYSDELSNLGRLRIKEKERVRLKEQKMMEEDNKDLLRRYSDMNMVYLSDAFDLFLGKPGLLICKFPWCNDHIELWVNYMWHVRPDKADWAIVSSYFVQLLFQKTLPLWYANGERYAIPWCDVNQVQLLDVLEQACVFKRKGINPSTYRITFCNANNVPKQWGSLVIVVYGMTSQDSEPTSCVDLVMPYSDDLVFDVLYDSCFMVYPLRDVKKSMRWLNCMELVVWQEEEANSSFYLRSPPIKPKTDLRQFKGKALFDDFEDVANDVVTDDFDDVAKNNVCGSLSSNNML